MIACKVFYIKTDPSHRWRYFKILIQYWVNHFNYNNHLQRSFICVLGDNGGEFIFCDECRTTYCLPCSKKLNKPVEMHEDDSCEDIQNGTASLVIVHVKKIREKILNLCCPKCGTAFLDFDGCGALNCSLATCKCAFCALCLKDCGMDAHSHVINCELNREKSFYISKDNLTHAHKTIRIEKLKEYFKKVSDQEREKVLQNLCKDLLDLGIALGNLE